MLNLIIGYSTIKTEILFNFPYTFVFMSRLIDLEVKPSFSIQMVPFKLVASTLVRTACVTLQLSWVLPERPCQLVTALLDV